MWSGLSEQGSGYEWVIFENMVQGFSEHHEVWICAMMVELNQHHNSKSRIYDWDVFTVYSNNTIAIWINVS
jgi:hypothetical protein